MCEREGTVVAKRLPLSVRRGKEAIKRCLCLTGCPRLTLMYRSSDGQQAVNLIRTAQIIVQAPPSW
jgi:hypothetical protein